MHLYVAKILTLPPLIQTFYNICKGFLYNFLAEKGFIMRNKYTKKVVIIVALTSIFAIPAPIAQISHPTCVFAEQMSNHTPSVQKLYVDVYDQETGKFLGRYLLDTETGYTDSPHRMFTCQEFPKIPGYGYIANAPLTPVNWKNASGVTDIKVFVVKKSSDLYKKTYGYQNDNKNDEDKQHHYKARRNEDGLLLDEEGQPIVHDLYHEYRSFLGYPCPGDSAGLSANAHLIYLFEKYFGYNPNLSKNQNYQQMDGQIAQAGKKVQNNATIKKKTGRL